MKPGKVPENVLKRSVLRQIGAKGREEGWNGAGIGKDCAFFPFAGDGKLVSCMQEAVVWSGECSSGAVRRIEGGGVRPESRAVYGAEADAEPESRAVYGAEVEPESRALCGGKAEVRPGNEEKCASEAVPGQNTEAFMTMADLIQKCANNLAAGGARPAAAMITLLLPEDTDESMLRRLMEEAAGKCKELDMEIAGGQSRITGAAVEPVAVVTGLGKTYENERNCSNVLPGKAASGQDIVLSKWIGLQGTAVVAKRNLEKLLARYPAYLVEEAAGFGRYLSVLPEAEIAVKNGVCAMHDASEGGILGALWEFAEGAGVGMTVEMRKLPLRQETVEVCECCNVNPYELMSGGCLIMACSDGPGLAGALEAEGIPAAVVGKVTDSKDRILVNGDEIRYMNRPGRDGVYGDSIL
ncbi:MAG TPA: hypothetical protein DCZ91_16270 [Lachnospiraceae bacterium]|nr:hypothetical protein [Lachnospiraceae bacterium]